VGFASAAFPFAVTSGADGGILHSRGSREKEVKASAFRQRQYLVGDRFRRIAFDLLTAIGAEGAADAGIEKPEIVEDFRLRSDGGAGIRGGVLLADRDGGTNADDLVNVGPVHPFEKLARISRQGLDVASLTFGVDGIESQRRFSRAADSSDHRKLVDRNID